MRIALYGDTADGLDLMIRDGENLIDSYNNMEQLQNALVSYDLICMSRQAMEQAFIASRSEVAFYWGKRLISCYVDEIYFVEAEMKDVHIHKEDGEFMAHMSFSKVEELLAEHYFLKVHRSYLVNCRYVSEMKNNEIILKNGKSLPISKYRFREVQAKYIDYLNSYHLNLR